MIFSILVTAALMLAGCAGNDDKTLNVYNWTYYIADDVIQDFEKEFGVKVQYETFSSNEELYTKLKSGATGYDLVFPSGDYVSIMIQENMVEKLDKSLIPNFQHIDPMVLAKIQFDKGNEYSVPYLMGTAGIAVNKKMVTSYEHSWNVFDQVALKGRMTMLDDMREVLGGALKSLGYSVNTVDPKQLEEAKQVVLRWKENIVKFDSDAFGKGFAAGEFWAVQGYAENVFEEYEDAREEEVDFFIPREGGPMYVDSMMILKDARHKELAYKFINFIHRPDIYARIADHLGYPAINVKARELTKSTPNYQIEDLINCEFKEDLGLNIDLYNNIWKEIRIGM
jgi:spermidine/putrescine transport system substrate-binding protein